jgi:hypothetical protein
MSSTDEIPRSGLYLDWCSEEAAKYACENYHYSETIPKGKRVRLGVWEGGEFIGAVLFGAGANTNIGSSLGLNQTEATELTRVALREHEAPVTQILSVARMLIEDEYPGIDALISYADPNQDHVGRIYQADNWIYMGKTDSRPFIVVDGSTYHPMAAYKNWGTSSAEKLRKNYPGLTVGTETRPGKHKYVYPLDDDVRNRAESMSEPYPDEP